MYNLLLLTAVIGASMLAVAALIQVREK